MMSAPRAATALIFILVNAAAAASDWIVIKNRSQLGFVATYDGVGFTARFENFDAGIRFDPKQLETGRFDVVVDISSVNSDSADRDQGMLEPEWFDMKQFPKARFVSTDLRRTGAGTFAVAGRLTIKNITRDFVLPFEWSESVTGARLQGKADTRRTDFEIGTGDWKTDPIIGFEVKILVDLYLERKH